MDRQTMTVLVVDDFPLARAIVVAQLGSLGHVVLDAWNSHDAMDVLAAHPEISILITDVKMPGTNGIELAKQAKSARPDLKVILISGYEDVFNTVSTPDRPVLQKPLRLEDLKRLIGQA
jgi:CheY-like chemotaxis protein